MRNLVQRPRRSHNQVMSPARPRSRQLACPRSPHFSVAVVNKSWAVFFKSSPANTLTDLELELIFDRRPATEAVRDEAAKDPPGPTTFLWMRRS